MSEVLRVSHAEVGLEGAVGRPSSGEPVSLTPLEVRLLRHLAANRERAVSTEELLVSVWGYRPGVQSRAATFTVNRLRAKIEADKAAPEHLVTVRGMGFQLRLPEPESSWWVGSAGTLTSFETALQDTGRVVVVGRAGVGKTAVVRAWRERGFDVVAHVSLADVADESSLIAAIAQTLSAGFEGPAERARQRLLDVLHDRPVTLVLDGAEAVADRLGAWCADLPGRLIITSRTPVAGLPTWNQPVLDEAHARALFVRCAQAHRPDWQGDPATVARIVERLDHLPLAIELTAASCRWFDGEQLLDRLRRDLGVHSTQSTLADAVRWAISLLQPAERRVFAWMDVFAGPVSVVQLEAVLPPLDVPLPDVLSTLEEHGLIRVSGLAPRVRLGVGVREAASQCLTELGEREDAEKSHRNWFVDEDEVALDELARVHKRELDRRPRLAQRALRRALPALPAVRTVQWILQRIEETQAVVDALDPSLRAYAGWCTWKLGDAAAASEMLDQAAADAVEDAVARAQAWSFAGALLQESGRRDDALVLFRKTVDALRQTSEAAAFGRALNALAIAQTHRQEFAAAREHVFEGLEASSGDAGTQALLLNTLGNLYLREGRLDDAARSYERAIGWLTGGERVVSGGPSVAVVGSNLAAVRLAQDRLDEAADLYEAAADAHRRSGRRRSLGLIRASIGRIHLLSDRVDDAIEDFRAAVALLEGVDDRVRASWTRAFHVAALYDGGQSDEAQRSMRILREHEAASGQPIGPALEALIAVHRACWKAQTGAGSWQDAQAALAELQGAAHPQLAPMVTRNQARIPPE
ncbi:MAG: winged helix-turn-helix domain-containing protein [Myxococcota bacterium]